VIESEGADFEKIIQTVGGGQGQVAYQDGWVDAAPISCGQIAGLIDKIQPVQAVVEGIVTEAWQVLHRLNRPAGLDAADRGSTP
jgi:hypothetical protein